MPPLPAVPNVARVLIDYQISEDAGAGSRLFYKYTGSAPSAADLTTWADAIGAAFSHLAPITSNVTTYVGVTCQDLSTDSGLEGVFAGAVVGTRSGEPLAASTTAVCDHKVARHYRGGKPKAFMPFGNAADLASAAEWLPASLADFQSAWSDFLAAIVSGAPSSLNPVKQVNVSYFKGSSAYDVGSGDYVRGKTKLTPRTDGPITDDVVSSVIRPIPGSQRRRLNP